MVAKCPLCNSNCKHELSSNDIMFRGDCLYDYAVCSGCSISFIYPMPSINKIKKFYPDSYMIFTPAKIKKFSFFEKLRLHYKHGYDFLLEPNFLFKCLFKCIPKLPEGINFKKNGRFLDVGCGNGSRMLKMRALGWNVTGVELNNIAVAECEKNSLKVYNSTLEKVDFKNNLYDVIYLSHLIEHVNNPEEILFLIHKILANNGHLYIKTPNRNSLGRKIFKRFWYANDIPRHLILYSKNSFELLSKKLGFEIIGYKEFTTPKIFLNSLDYSLNRKNTSKRNKFARFFARFYIFFATILKQGDESYYILKKKA